MATIQDRGRRDVWWVERPEWTIFAEPIDSDGIVVRRATVADLAVVTAMRFAETSDRKAREAVATALMSGGLLVAEREGRVVAEVTVSVPGAPGTRLGDALVSWTVVPSRRLEGIGRAVSVAVMERLVDFGCEGVIVRVPPDAQGACAHLEAIGLEVEVPRPGLSVLATIEADRVRELRSASGPRL